MPAIHRARTPLSIPQTDRHAMIWLGRGSLRIEHGSLRFSTPGTRRLDAGDYTIPYQALSAVLLEPGTRITHDVFRLLAAHDTSLFVVGQDGTRLYASLPAGKARSQLARRHATHWACPTRRLAIARAMYARKLGEIVPNAPLDALRGIEGARAKVMYQRLAGSHNIEWHGRRYSRSNPESNDLPNQAINHASRAVVSAAEVATAVAGAIPQLGFIHEDASISFALDLADLYRETLTVDTAFAATAHVLATHEPIERVTRTMIRTRLRAGQIVANMITTIQELLA